MTTNERVATVGLRNQVTLPKEIRKNVRIVPKQTAFISSLDKDDCLVISLEPPDNGVFNRIKISEKGQLVIPKNLRDSKHIKEGTNLVFTVKNDREITMKKLKERCVEPVSGWRWQFLVDILTVLEPVSDLTRMETGDRSLVLVLKEEDKNSLLINVVNELEHITGSRLMVERKGKKIYLRSFLS
ncbi:MAG: AbrB/MazE/SpoVT family DNA-binding domain-containing protein [Candidatus Odinarchaeota archaeon]